MASTIPEEWRSYPPESLVAGDGPYALALASVVGTVPLSLACLRTDLDSEGGLYDRFLSDVTRVFLVIGDSVSAAEALRCHQAIWDWIGKLAPAGDEHDLAFLFILPPATSKGFQEALAVGLSVPEIDPATTGHAV